ncbi:MAG: ABC transporter ATP-binding protein, partial [Halobacteriaceae archaeon]
MIDVADFTFQYPTADEPALSDISVSVEAGEVLGVVGPVEAGKTSLAMALSGFVPGVTGGWTDGDIAVAGRDPRDAEDNRTAMVFEDYSSQLTQLRLVDEVIAPLTNRGFSREKAHDRARELLDQVRLDEPEEKYTWELSGGQQQRLAIAAALAIDPDVLVFDTATDMLDPEGRADVANLIASLAGEMTLVVTENDPDALVGVADKLLVIDGGTDVAFGDADELLRDRDLLDSVGVAPPVCLEVADRLGIDGAPLTPGEFLDCYHDQAGANAVPGPVSAADGGPVEPRTVGGGAPDAGWEAPVLEVEGVSFEYPDGTAALSDVDMTVHEGEVHAVIGGNGAGKSTLTKLLVGVMRPTEGSVTVAGTPTDEVTARMLGETVGISMQNPDEQLSRRTVDAELRHALDERRYESTGPFGLFGKRERYDEAYIEERVRAVRDLVDIDDSIRGMDPLFLPQGLRRLVTIGSALAPDPEAVVLDEPAAGTDVTERRVV